MFTRENGMSAVTRQPRSREEAMAAAQALLSCPTFSIHMRDGDQGLMQVTVVSIQRAETDAGDSGVRPKTAPLTWLFMKSCRPVDDVLFAPHIACTQ